MGNQPTALRPEVLGDLTMTTEFEADEIRTYYRQFIKECNEGHLSLDIDRFKKLYIEIFPNGDPTKFAEHVFRTFDQERNGKIDFREFMMAVNIQQNGSYGDRLKWLFHMFDVDGTGYISVDELETLISALRRLRGHDLDGTDSNTSVSEIAEYIMSKTDKDNDHKLSEREFVAGALVSRTMETMMQGALSASAIPFTPMRARSYSYPKRKISTLRGPHPET